MPNAGDIVMVTTSYGPMPAMVLANADSTDLDLTGWGLPVPTGTEVILTQTDLGNVWNQPALMDVGTDVGTYAVIS